MAWFVPRTWIALEKVYAYMFDQHVGQNVDFLGDSDWVDIGLAGGWVSFDGGVTYDDPQCRRIGNTVFLKGLIKSGAIGVLGTIPAGMRPGGALMFEVSSASGIARIVVNQDGSISVTGYAAGGSNAHVALEVHYLSEK